MWSLGKGIHFVWDAIKILFHDNIHFFTDDFWAAIQFVVKEKIWCIIATIMGLVITGLIVGVHFAIGYGDDYARSFAEATLIPDLKGLWNKFHDVPHKIASHIMVINHDLFGWDMMKEFPGQATWVHILT